MNRCSVFIALAGLLATPASAESYFEGKTITIITSTGAGGTYDTTARAIARHMPNLIPGHPVMIVQNMPGGGNVLATNYMYNVASKDGTVIATINDAIPLHQALGGQGVRYDASKFNWLGSTGPENEPIYVWFTAPISNIEDAQKKEVILGATGAGSDLFIIPTAVNSILGTKFKVVIGYKSSEDVNLAMQRGEVQGRAGGFASIVSQHHDWIEEHKIKLLIQMGSKRDRDMPDVPLATEIARTEDQRQILQLISSPSAIGHAYISPPAIPEERIAILRKAFMATLADAGFLADMQKLHIEIDPMPGEYVAEIVRTTINAKPDIVRRAKAAMEPKLPPDSSKPE